MDLDAERGKLLRHEIRGAVLLEAELGMGMQIAPPSDQVVRKGAYLIDRGHGGLPSRGQIAVRGRQSWKTGPLVNRFGRGLLMGAGPTCAKA